jgi:hypothetical protein
MEGSGSRRPKIVRIRLQIRVRNTGYKFAYTIEQLCCYRNYCKLYFLMKILSCYNISDRFLRVNIIAENLKEHLLFYFNCFTPSTI